MGFTMLSIAKPDNLLIKLTHITVRGCNFLDAWINNDGIILRTCSLQNEREHDWFLLEDGNIVETLCTMLGKTKHDISINKVFQIGEGGFTKGYTTPICDLNWSDLLSTGTTLHFNIWDSNELRSDCEIQAAQMELLHTPFGEPVNMHVAHAAAEIAFAAIREEHDSNIPSSCRECVRVESSSLEDLAKSITNAKCGCLRGASSLFVQNGLIFCGICLQEIEDDHARCACLEPTVTRVLCGPDLIVSGQCFSCGLRMSKEVRENVSG